MSASSFSDVELFLLGLVSASLSTPYDLKAQAGLSVGSTAPVLARLEKAGMITAGKPGVRGSRRFAITKAGEKALKGWRGLLDVRPGSIEEALRVIYLAWSAGDPASAAEFAEQAATDLLARAATRKAEAAQLGNHFDGKRPGESYRRVKLRAEAAELEADARMLGELKGELTEKKTNRGKNR